MASSRSHAASHSRNTNQSRVIRNFVQRRVLKGHVSIRNPLQAPKERSCGISIISPSLSWFRKAGPAAHTQSACICGCVTMARRHSHAASHSRNANQSRVIRNFVQRRVLKGHVSIRNPLQAPKERSCGISIISPSLLVPQSGTRSSYSICLHSWVRDYGETP